jgi:L-iditol 2-dehydrogenase
MQAVVNHGPGDYRLESVTRPRLEVGELLFAIDAAGVCGSDGKCFAGGNMFWGGDEPWVQAPVIPGHEFFGTVVETGAGAKDLHEVAIGDKVVAEQIYPCDRCRYCRHGQYWMCEVHNIYGFQGGVADGAWAEFMRLGRRSRVHRMPDDIRPEQGVLVEPLACAIHATERADVQLGDTVVIAGAGPIGLLILQVVRLRSPGRIIVTDTNPARLTVADHLGADVTIDVSNGDLGGTVRAMTDGYGCDVFIEASGHPAAVSQGLDALRKLGRMVVYGDFATEVRIDWSIIGDRKELDILGAHLGPYAYPKAIDYLHRGVIDAEAMITDVLPLHDVDRALKTLQDGTAIKIMLLPR